MKKNFVCVMTLLLALMGFAAEASDNKLYLGLKGGPVTSPVSGMDDATNIGLLLGCDFYQSRYGSLAAELEGTTTIIEGDVTIPAFFDGTWRGNTVGLFLAWRTPHALYLKAKGGLEYVDLALSQAGRGFSDTGWDGSWGAGAGWRLHPSYSVEAEYTRKTSLSVQGDAGDITMWTVGMNFNF